MEATGVTGRAGAQMLVPYVPRLVIQWAHEAPDARWRELEGTLAFVDISGFTAMSERLSSRGKAGAEEVNAVMNATFARLLEIAYAFGGGLLKFGGDALLLFFDGHEHQTRAATAVFGLRAALEEIGRPETSAGPVELRMHVGVHSDAFRFFLVGDAHRELIVAGPGASHTVAMEAGAEPGEILLSEATASALPPHVLGQPKAGGVLLAAPPEVEARLEPLPDVEQLDLEHFVPVEVRAHVQAVAAEPEHRAASVAFLHVGGLDGPAEAAAEALDALVRTVQAAAQEHGVCFLETDIDSGGTKIVLTAGAPSAHENDEERMLRTVGAVVESAPPLPLRIGVSRGRVFAGEVGAEFRRTYTILGDTAALAARLMARAEPGQVLAAADVVERSRTEFETTQLEPFRVKGKSEPVLAVELGPVRGTRERGRGRLPLVDRVREMAVLDAALGPVRIGFGTLVELVGEPGIGKSRIVEELQDRASDLRQLATGCEQYEASTPYHPFRGLLRGLLGVELDSSPEENTERLRLRLDEIDPELVPWIPLVALALDAEVLPTPEADELDPAFRRARLNGVVGTLLATLLDEASLLLFEDVHWMDEASSDLLRHVASQISSRPWLACATRRPVPGGFAAADGVPPVPALTLALEPLPAEDARELVAAVAGATLPDEELEAITARAGGNPLFLQELAGAGAEPDELPESVEAMVAAKVDRLDPSDRALLRWASVLGSAFSGEVLSEVLRDDPSAAADSEAWDRLGEFVERDPDVAGGFRFRHALIRDTAYEGLSFARRRELHARVGAVYEERAAEPDESAELLSLHFSRAEAHDKAWHYSLAAAERARAKWANADAGEFYRRALEAAGRLPELAPAELAAVWEALGDVSELAGLYGDAGAAYGEARRLAEAEGPQPGLLLKEGIVLERGGDYAGALRGYAQGREAAELLPEGAERTRHAVRLALATAGIHHRQGRFADCVHWCHDALPDALDLEDLESIAHAYYLLHLAYTSLGRPERRDFRGLALPIYEELGDLLGQANVLNNLGIEAYYEGRWDEALDLYDRSRKLRERIGDVVGAATITGNIGEILSDQGRLEEARELFEAVEAVVSGAGARLLQHVAESNLGRLAARDGRFEVALATLETALAGFEELDAASFALEARARLAELDVLRGDRAAGALAVADASLGKGAAPAVEAMLQRVRGYALRQTGDEERARAAFDESLLIARTADAEYEAALTLAALGRETEAAAILARLGVVAVPEIPV